MAPDQIAETMADGEGEPAGGQAAHDHATHDHAAGFLPSLTEALSLIQLGQWDEAEAPLRQVLTMAPAQIDATVYLARLLIDRQQRAEAIALLGPALDAAPDRMQAFAPLVFDLWGHGAADAAPLLRRLADRDPTDLAANFLIGEWLARTGEAAARLYSQRVADGTATDMLHWVQQGVSLMRLGDVNRAEARLRHALTLAPCQIDATVHLTRLLIDRDRLADAIALLGPGMEAAPPDRLAPFAPLVVELWSRGAADSASLLRRLADGDPSDLHSAFAASITADQLIGAGRVQEAIALLARVIDAAPPNLANLAVPIFHLRHRGVAQADSWLERLAEHADNDAVTLAELAKTAYYCEAPDWCILFAAQARALADTPELRLATDLVLPLTPASPGDIDVWVDRFRTHIEALTVSGLRIDDPLKPFVQPPHYAPFCYGLNPRDLYATASRAWQALHPDLTWTAPHCQTWRSRPARRRFRIGFLTQPTFPLVWGIARALDREQFEVGLLFEQSARRASNDAWSGAVDWAVAIPDTSIAAAREAIAGQTLDILIHMPWLGLRYFLSHARLAPVQCVLAEPAYTDGSPYLDYYVSWAPAEPANPEEFYTSAVALMNRAPYWIEREYTRPAQLPRTMFNLPPAAHWYVCPGTALKMHPAFDRVLARILTADPQGILILLRGEHHQTRAVEHRLRAALGPAADRLHVLPGLPPDRCHALLVEADAVLDSWPIGGMSSSYVAIHAGIPTVTLPAAIPFGRWLASMYETIGVTDLIAADENDYVRLALRLAADRPWRRRLAERIRANNATFIEDHLAVRELEQFLTTATAAAHAGHPPRPWRDGRFL